MMGILLAIFCTNADGRGHACSQTHASRFRNAGSEALGHSRDDPLECGQTKEQRSYADAGQYER